jgi:hypothetical protein
MAIREGLQEATRRWDDLKVLQNHYKSFRVFLWDVITDVMGFSCSPIQQDIADYLQYGPSYKMIQAQRGQAKTTITAAYAVWRIIHDPTTRVLIFSAGSDMASQVSGFIVQIIMNMPELECLRPDRRNGDRTAVDGFDIHYSLKGPEKSPSVACLGITSNSQGFRADILIADDIESSKNSQTATQRERLDHLSLDFSSICSRGDIIWLGTPQSVDSIYNRLPSRGFAIRIWTGRYPTREEVANYGDYLAPIIIERITADPSLQTGGGPTGNRGKAVDPILMPEEELTRKEIAQGPAYFQLQHMLDTKLMDEDRYPLKSSKIVFLATHKDRAPILINWSQAEINRIKPPAQFPLKEFYYSGRADQDTEYAPFQATHMYVDPTGGGQNGDELAYAVTRFIAAQVHCVAVGGMLGGPTLENFEKLNKVVSDFKPNQIDVEENYGKGAFAKLWTPSLLAVHKCSIVDVWETGQKELRIIDTLEPLLGSNRLIMDPELLEADWRSVQKYPAEMRMTYSLFWQLARITRDKGSLKHDDRLDALAGSCRFWVDRLALDQQKANATQQAKAWRELMKNPLGNGRQLPNYQRLSGGLIVKGRQMNALDRFKRRK